MLSNETPVNTLCLHIKYISAIQLFSQVWNFFSAQSKYEMNAEAFMTSLMMDLYGKFRLEISAPCWLYDHWKQIKRNNWNARNDSGLLQQNNIYQILTEFKWGDEISLMYHCIIGEMSHLSSGLPQIRKTRCMTLIKMLNFG